VIAIAFLALPEHGGSARSPIFRTETQMTWIILPPEKLIFGVGPEDKVYVQLRYSPDQTGLPPDVELAIALTPNEARAFAEVLSRKADEAEAAERRRRGQRPGERRDR
jgi:hypothetical protein